MDTSRDAVVGAAVAAVGLLLAVARPGGGLIFLGLVAVGMGAAVACVRIAPGAALTLVWLVAGAQVFGGVRLNPVELAALAVTYGASRYGTPLVLWASGLSIPAGVAFVLYERGYYPTRYEDLGSVIGAVLSVVPVVSMVVLAVPWTIGLVLRGQDATALFRERERVARTDRDAADRARSQAQEIAELRDRQNRLARDVHDVVGHSLSVILAQSEAAKLLPRDRPEQLRETMDTISVAARQSLLEVRSVLATSDDKAPDAPPASSRDTLESLVVGVRASGADVRLQVEGEPRPLPPELDAVAYRTLQEMLTNALRHGDRRAPVHVEQSWKDELMLEVRNEIPAGQPSDDAEGRGVDGMRIRLESVGGRLDVRRSEGSGEQAATFIAMAWLPVRG